MQESDFPSREAYVQARIAFLKEKLESMGGFVGEVSEEMDPEQELAFLEHIWTFEQAPSVTHAHQLIGLGISLPPPDDLDDTALHRKLWEVINGLAKLRVFLEQTNHLSDRQLYEHLWSDALNEYTYDMSENLEGAAHLPMLSYEDEETYLAFYARDDEREEWAEANPDSPIPPRQAPIADRDDDLPQPYA
jgi:hypothetical protein